MDDKQRIPKQLCNMRQNIISGINRQLKGSLVFIIILGVFLQETQRHDMIKFGNKITLVN
jgi:hypothetical protein